MGAKDIRFSSLQGAQLKYMRNANRKPKPVTFASSPELYRTLLAFTKELKDTSRRAGYGQLTTIVSAGVFVDKPGEHGKGNAIDFDRFEWNTGRACSPIYGVHQHPKAWARRRYLAVDALCRIYFRWVLDGHHNRQHSDHIHADLGGLPVRLSRYSRSETVFIQAICREFGGQRIAIDSVWGAQTSRALMHTLGRAGLEHLDPLRSRTDYKRFLRVVAYNGFRARTFN